MRQERVVARLCASALRGKPVF